MKLIIKDDKVIATHPDDVGITQDQYPDCEIIYYDGSVEPLSDDPRTNKEKKESYKDKRRLAYPSVEEQFDLMYWDLIDGTTNWRDAISTVKYNFPKPEDDDEQ